MRALLIGIAMLALGWSDAVGQASKIPPIVAAVQTYIMGDDYPEVFGDTNYRTKIENVEIADLDGDGRDEVIMHFVPHYRQSPTIMIYRVAPDMTVMRVKEGLAPGTLQPLSGDYLDSHTLGEAVDLDLAKDQHDPSTRKKFIDATLDQFAGVVEYRDFFHVDGRKGNGVYIDMTRVEMLDKSKTCGDFEFSSVKQIDVGSVSGLGGGNLLAAWAQDKIYLYRIKSFTDAGMLDKQMWTVDVMADFEGFATGSSDTLQYQTRSGEAKPFAIKCDGARCVQAAN